MTWRKSSFSGSATDCVELAWRKSSFSAAETDCVELAWPTAGIAMRDSKNTTGPVLLLNERTHAALITALKA